MNEKFAHIISVHRQQISHKIELTRSRTKNKLLLRTASGAHFAFIVDRSASKLCTKIKLFSFKEKKKKKAKERIQLRSDITQTPSEEPSRRSVTAVFFKITHTPKLGHNKRQSNTLFRQFFVRLIKKQIFASLVHPNFPR